MNKSLKTGEQPDIDIIELKLNDKTQKIKKNPKGYEIFDLLDVCRLNQMRDNLTKN